MYETQDGKCLVCGGWDERLNVDHDHKTDTVRGLLCQRCNVGLGWFEDDPERLNRAIKYLESSF